MDISTMLRKTAYSVKQLVQLKADPIDNQLKVNYVEWPIFYYSDADFL